jgi:predicted nucleic acid-binding Zn ribbon protein
MVEPKRRKRYATIVYDALAVIAVAIIALDTAKFFEFSPTVERYFRGGAIVLGAVLVSDKVDLIRDRQRQRRRRR